MSGFGSFEWLKKSKLAIKKKKLEKCQTYLSKKEAKTKEQEYKSKVKLTSDTGKGSGNGNWTKNPAGGFSAKVEQGP